jgi:hypothetical protein
MAPSLLLSLAGSVFLQDCLDFPNGRIGLAGPIDASSWRSQPVTV